MFSIRLLITAILAAACANAPALELTMSKPEAAMCEREGGCTVLSQALLQQMLDQARRAGMETCESRI